MVVAKEQMKQIILENNISSVADVIHRSSTVSRLFFACFVVCPKHHEFFFYCTRILYILK